MRVHTKPLLLLHPKILFLFGGRGVAGEESKSLILEKISREIQKPVCEMKKLEVIHKLTKLAKKPTRRGCVVTFFQLSC